MITQKLITLQSQSAPKIEMPRKRIFGFDILIYAETVLLMCKTSHNLWLSKEDVSRWLLAVIAIPFLNANDDFSFKWVDEEGLVAEHQTTSPKVMGLNPTGNRASVFFFYFFFLRKLIKNLLWARLAVTESCVSSKIKPCWAQNFSSLSLMMLGWCLCSVLRFALLSSTVVDRTCHTRNRPGVSSSLEPWQKR